MFADVVEPPSSRALETEVPRALHLQQQIFAEQRGTFP